MILVDTNAWIEHLRKGDARLARFLLQQRVRTCDVVIGELLLGSGLPASFARDLRALPRVPSPNAAETRAFVERHGRSFAGAGVGWAARTVGRGGYETAHDLSAFRRVLEVNTIGTFDCIRIVATAMAETEPLADGERGAIVNTASVAAFDGQIGQAAYSASKGGIVGMTLPIARDLSAVGVRVCTIAPGLIDTPIYGEGPGSEEFKEKLKRDVLFPKRLGVAAEFATLAVEVLANSYMNAEVIRLDAGARLQPK